MKGWVEGCGEQMLGGIHSRLGRRRGTLYSTTAYYHYLHSSYTLRKWRPGKSFLPRKSQDEAAWGSDVSQEFVDGGRAPLALRIPVSSRD